MSKPRQKHKFHGRVTFHAGEFSTGGGSTGGGAKHRGRGETWDTGGGGRSRNVSGVK